MNNHISKEHRHNNNPPLSTGQEQDEEGDPMVELTFSQLGHDNATIAFERAQNKFHQNFSVIPEYCILLQLPTHCNQSNCFINLEIDLEYRNVAFNTFLANFIWLAFAH